jgi:hypothetical protein
VPKKQKQLSYRRAEYFVDAQNHSVEGHLRKSLSILKTIEQRRVVMGNSFTMEARHAKPRTRGGVLLHIAGYTPGEEASIVPSKPAAPEADVSTAPPPRNSDYMDGDIMLFARHNDVIVCVNGMHEARVRDYLRGLFEAAGLGDDAANFGLSRVADASKVQLIAQHGVKQVKLNASLYEASLDHIERTSVKQKLLGTVWDEFLAIFADDVKMKEISERENLTAEVVIKFDRRREGGEIGQERLAALATAVVEDDDEGFAIETLEGETIRSNQITLRKAVAIEAHGKSVYYSEAFDELLAYYDELTASGVLHQ